MFASRKYSFAATHGLNKRRLYEEFYHMAAQFCQIDSDCFRSSQFQRSHFVAESFMVGYAQDTYGEFTVVTTTDSYIPVEIESRKFNGPGIYNISWSVTGYVKTSGTYHLEAYPYLGSTILTHIGDIVHHPHPWGTITAIDPSTAFYDFPFEDEQEYVDDISLSGSGIAATLNDTLRCGVVGFVNPGGRILLNGASISVLERLQ